MLSIVDKNGKSRVSSVMGVPKGMDAPEAVNAPILFDLENYLAGDTSVYDGLSDGLKGIIQRCKELTDPVESAELAQAEHEAADHSEDFDDDIPF